jgi:acetolactate synthase-1/2/3 large subunit
MKVSDLVIEFLENKNISHVFTVSGGGCIHLIDSLGKSEKLKYVCIKTATIFLSAISSN